MVRSVATKWIIGLVIYFVVLFLFMSMISQFSDDYHLEEGGIISSSGGGTGAIISAGGCANPREELKESDAKCSSLMSLGTIYDNTSCEEINGCVWEEKNSILATITLGFLGTSTFTCRDNINVTFYNNNVTFGALGDGAGGNAYSWLVTEDVCDLAGLDERGLCQSFGCTWYYTDALENLNYKKGIFVVLDVIGDIITFRVNFSTGSSSINALLTLFLIWIPLIILILSGYIMIR